ncbi:major facilitator superfamily domain-containing protein [Phyllosticta citribraziliensis]|uniref:Major facilitator superfamily domain-containing protein n=1 Tax=Phyllosticta citribraziliensis TaxID=989973 RepID=A0ABR1LMC0_9PEZI
MGETNEDVLPPKGAEEASTGSSVGAVVPDWTEEEERAVRRKIDWHLIPLLTVLYLFCFLDRANIGNAYIEGLKEDLKLRDHQFNWALTIFFVVFGLCDIPSSILLKRLGGAIWIPFLFIGFGLISLCTAFVRNYTDLMLARAFLGGFEGGVIPCFAFYLSLFYRRTEHLFRVSIFIATTMMAGGFGGLLASGFSNIPSWGVDSMRIHTWRNIFFFEGLITMLLGIGAIFFLVSTPMQCKFLDERERYIATERLLLDHRIDWMEPVERRHVKAAICNIHTTICAVGFMCSALTLNSLAFSMPAILRNLGWTSTKAQLMTVPPFVFGWLTAIVFAFFSDRMRRRGVFIVPLALFGVVGFSVLVSSPSVKYKYMAMFFAASGLPSAGIIYLCWGLNNVASPAVRAVAGGYITVLGTFAALTATWTYLPENAPSYTQGHAVNLAVSALSVATALTGIAYVHYENGARSKGRRDGRLEKELDGGEGVGAGGGGGGAERERLELLLGHRHPRFRYIP